LELPSGKAAVRGRAKQADQLVVEGGKWIGGGDAAEDSAARMPGNGAGIGIDGVVEAPEGVIGSDEFGQVSPLLRSGGSGRKPDYRNYLSTRGIPELRRACRHIFAAGITNNARARTKRASGGFPPAPYCSRRMGVAL
jgi:hypothetical protein